MSTGQPFVGRRAEQAELRRAWDALTSGRSRLVVLTGDPGIGKTTLVDHFLRRLEPERLVWVRGVREEQTLPWGVIDQLARALSAPSRPQFAWGGPNPEADPLYIGQSLFDDLRTIEETVIVVDDVQWADRQSQAALRFVARRMFGCPVLLIVLHGGETRLDDNWRRVCESEHALLLELTGLSAEELVSLAAARGKYGLSPAGAARLFRHTGGNPLHASALLDQLPMRAIVSGSGPLPAPATVAETVVNALISCAEPVQSVLTAGAVIGADFDAAQVRALTEATDVAKPLDEAMAAGLITEVAGATGLRFTFSHALVHRAVYEHASLSHRRQLHLRAAALADGAEALQHRVAAADQADAELAADLELQAARDVSRGRLAIAAQHLEQALNLTAPGPERAPRLLAVVEAKLIAGDAVAASRYAEELSAGGGDPWWDYVAGYQTLLAGQVDEARAKFGQALDAIAANGVPPRAPADLRARIATMLAVIGLVSLSYPEMMEYGQIAVAENSADRRVSAFAWFARTVGLALAGRGREALAELDAADGNTGLDPLVARGIIKLWTDDLTGAQQCLSEAVDRAYRGEALRVGQALAFLGEAEYRRGLLADSILHTELALGDAEENQRVWDFALLHGLACYARAARGDWAEAEAHAEAAGTWAPLIGARSGLVSAAGTRAVIAQARGDAAVLLSAAEALDAVFDPLEPGITLLGPLRAEALIQLGREKEAVAALAEYTDRFGAIGRKSTDLGIARVRGRIETARGAHAEAMGHYASAFDLAEALRLPLEAGRIEMLMGECLAASGNYDGAGSRLRAALRRFTAIGAAAYAALTQEVFRRLGLPSEEPSDRLAVLSGAERRVVLLVLERLSNAEIARQLSIQKGTVEFHLTNAYNKLGITGRSALHRLFSGPR